MPMILGMRQMMTGGTACCRIDQFLAGVVIPVLAYPVVDQAADWLCDAFGFTVRLRIFHHRVQMNVGGDGGALVVRELRENETNQALGMGHSVMIRVEDADAHYKRAGEHGAKMTQEPTTYPFGERQFDAKDFAGHSGRFRSRWRTWTRRRGANSGTTRTAEQL
jgi:uncharacterized glyoxalase superfamily protein PhnB